MTDIPEEPEAPEEEPLDPDDGLVDPPVLVGEVITGEEDPDGEVGTDDMDAPGGRPAEVDSWSEVDPEYVDVMSLESAEGVVDEPEDTLPVEAPEEDEEDTAERVVDDGEVRWVQYELWGRNISLGEGWTRYTVADFAGDIEAEVNDLTAGTDLQLRIRLVDTLGRFSKWSDAIQVRLASDFTPPPRPVGLSVLENNGIVVTIWDGELEDDTPPDFDHAPLYVQQMHPSGNPDGPEGDPQRVAEFQNGGRHTSGDFVDRVEYRAWMTAVDTTGNESPRSEYVYFTATEPVDGQRIRDELEVINGPDGRLPALERDLETVNTDLVVLRDTTVPAIGQELSGARSDIDTLRDTTIPVLRGELSALERVTGEGFEKAEEEYLRLQAKADAAKAAADAVESSLEATDEELSSTRAAADAAQEKADAAQAEVDRLSTTVIPGLERDLSTAREDLDTLTDTTIPGIRETLGGLNTSLSGLDMRLAVEAARDGDNLAEIDRSDLSTVRNQWPMGAQFSWVRDQETPSPDGAEWLIRVASETGSGYPTSPISNDFAVTVGEQILVEYEVRGEITAGNFAVNLRSLTADRSVARFDAVSARAGGSLTPEWTVLSGVATVRPGEAYIRAEVKAYNFNGWGEIGRVRIRRMVREDLVVSGAISTEKLAANAVEAEKIAARAVTAEKIRALAVEAEHLAADSVTARSILAESVGTDALSANAVTAVKIVAGAVNTEKLAALSVSTEKLVAEAVTAEKIRARAITAEKIEALAVEAEHLAANSVTADKIRANSVGAEQIDAVSIAADEARVNQLWVGFAGIAEAQIDELLANSVKAKTITAPLLQSHTNNRGWKHNPDGTSEWLDINSGTRNTYIGSDGKLYAQGMDAVGRVRAGNDDVYASLRPADNQFPFPRLQLRSTAGIDPAYLGMGLAGDNVPGGLTVLASSRQYSRRRTRLRMEQEGIWSIGPEGSPRGISTTSSETMLINSTNQINIETATDSPVVIRAAAAMGNPTGLGVGRSTSGYYAQVYTRTGSFSPNTYIDPSFNIVYRTTSLENTKVDIDREPVVDLALVKQLNPTTFRDRGAVERGEETPTQIGLIAEDVAALGLDILTTLDGDGEVNGVAYDRVPEVLILWNRELEARIVELEARLIVETEAQLMNREGTQNGE